MKRFFIRHKLKVGDFFNLSDSESELIISKNLLQFEDIFEAETLDGIYLAQVTDISASTVQGMVLKTLITNKKHTVKNFPLSVTIIQAITNDSKFNYFLEKAVEIGVDRIIPVESHYSLLKKSKAEKKAGMWQKIIRDASEQSRNHFPTILDDVIKIDDLSKVILPKADRYCLATEAVESRSVQDVVSKGKSYIIAIGPEKGWHSRDLAILKKLRFQNIKLKGNILRTETAGLVIATILKYTNGQI